MRRLAIRPGGIGDSILGFPALEHLALGGTLEVWARAEVLPLIHFATTNTIEGTGLGLLGLEEPNPQLVERLQQFDEIYTWYGAARDDFREAITALHPRVNFLPALPTDDSSHAADFFAAQVGASLPAIPRIDVKPVRNRMVLIHPFSGSQKKNWLLQNFQLLERWLESTGRSVQFLVAPHQRIPGTKVVADLSDLAGLLAGASLYIGNDSGITHLAAASGANTLALFGPTNPAVWSPRGDHVRILHSENLDDLSVERVLDAALAQTGFEQNSA
ncbi:MAG: glycosyltransferase family 9 protein [Acidobacteria bacterium]|nr:glycosyltransferase family 9 protein [Acidobacteriota bacterium]